MRRAFVLLSLGVRTGLRGGSSAAVHRWSMAVAAAVAVLTCWLLAATGAVMAAREARVAHRQPVFVTQDADSSATARWIPHSDFIAGQQFLILYVSPSKDDVPPPPGLPRWPEPGEAFLSPRLLQIGATHDIKHRYGAFGGVIGPQGLADPTELIAYYRPPTDRAFDERRGVVAISGFGVDPAELGDQYSPETLPGPKTWTTTDIDLLVLLVVGLPAALLLALAARSNAERRDRRLAMLDALGAPASARAWVLIGEAARPVVLGAVIGGLIAYVTSLEDIHLPLADYVVTASDMSASRSMIIPFVGAVVVGVVVLVLVAQLRGRARHGTTLRKVRQRFRGWAQSAFPLAVIVAIWGAGAASGSGYSLGLVAFLLGIVAALVTLPAVLGSVAAVGGRWIAAFGGRAGAPSAVVGGRWLRERPALTARLCAVFVIGLGLIVQAQVEQTWIIERTRGLATHSASGSATVGDRLISVRTKATLQGINRFSRDVGPDNLLRIGTADDQTIFAGTCAALRRLGTMAGCPAGIAPLTTVFDRLNPIGTAAASGTVISDPHAMVTTDPTHITDLVGFFVINDAGGDGADRIEQAAYADLTKPYVATPGAYWIAGGIKGAAVYDWVLVFGVAGLVVLALAGALAAANTFLSHIRSLGVLGTFDGRRRLYLGIAAWNLGLPLLCAGVVGSALAAFLGLLTIHLRGVGTLSLDVLGSGVAAVAVLASVLTGACGTVAARAVHTWRPTVE